MRLMTPGRLTLPCARAAKAASIASTASAVEMAWRISSSFRMNVDMRPPSYWELVHNFVYDSLKGRVCKVRARGWGLGASS